MHEAVKRESGDVEFGDSLFQTRPHLISKVAAFLPADDFREMGQIVKAIESASRLFDYRSAVLSRSPEIAAKDHGPLGAFMGYDFHVGTEGPKLIEVNTNAGGAFLNALLARAQRACCRNVVGGGDLHPSDNFDAAVVAMFRNEWRLQRGSAELRRLAIVDDRPTDQYLYPEFLLARGLLQSNGIDAIIADPSELSYTGGKLQINGQDVDLVYNRLVDFPLDWPGNAAIRRAYRDGNVVLTPNPHNHAMLADKRNLLLLSDGAALTRWGLLPEYVAALASVLETRAVTAETADALWAARKRFFFKPASGYGGKAVYRGDKITRGVWAEITQGEYIAQAFAAPGERMIELDGEVVLRKMDVRLYTYDGDILLVAARLYQGQTTNFRTPGGGFAPVLIA